MDILEYEEEVDGLHEEYNSLVKDECRLDIDEFICELESGGEESPDGEGSLDIDRADTKSGSNETLNWQL